MEYQMKGNYFHDKFHPLHTSTSSKTIKKTSPANGNHSLWELSINTDHVNPVVESAQKGFQTWRQLSFEKRGNFLKAYKKIVVEKREEIARAIALETGKPLWESLTEATALGSKVDITLGASLERIANQSFENILPSTRGEIYHRPIGPTLIIGPFNFPCHLANGQILCALIAGNSIIFKPSEKTAYSGQLLVECFQKAGFPEGVINLIQGDASVVTPFLKAKPIKGIFFTGSKEVGKTILKNTYEDLSKLVALELGGKNTTIVHNDAPYDLALAELLKSCFLTAGQRCTSTSMIAIHRSIAEQFIKSFSTLSQKIIIDHPINSAAPPFMGPLIDEKSMANYLNFMKMAQDEGFNEVLEGKAIKRAFPGHYVTPSIHYKDKLDTQSVFLKSEIFGPNTTFIPYDHIEEAIAIANIPDYGLACSVFTKDDAIFTHCASSIDTGLINHNRPTIGASAQLPFGGIKNSGNYRPAAVSMIDSCVYPQSCLRVNGSQTAPTDLDKIVGLMT